jgi:hypothetical protein
MTKGVSKSLTRSARNRNSLKKSAVIKQTEQIDSERLIKAIQYLQEHPKG